MLLKVKKKHMQGIRKRMHPGKMASPSATMKSRLKVSGQLKTCGGSQVLLLSTLEDGKCGGRLGWSTVESRPNPTLFLSQRKLMGKVCVGPREPL